MATATFYSDGRVVIQGTRGSRLELRNEREVELVLEHTSIIAQARVKAVFGDDGWSVAVAPTSRTTTMLRVVLVASGQVMFMDTMTMPVVTRVRYGVGSLTME